MCGAVRQCDPNTEVGHLDDREAPSTLGGVRQPATCAAPGDTSAKASVRFSAARRPSVHANVRRAGM